jgi:hypothetical protein
MQITECSRALFTLQHSELVWNLCAFPKTLKFRCWD